MKLFCAVFFFFNDTATTEIYTLSLHDALPISAPSGWSSSAITTPVSSPAAAPAAGRSAPSPTPPSTRRPPRSEEHTSELQSPCSLVCRLLLEKKKKHIKSICVSNELYVHLPLR